MTAMARWNDAPVMSLRDAFDRLFENAFTPVMGGNSGTSSAGIATNVWETGDGYQVAMLMPGVNPEQITLTTLGNTITVEGSLEFSQPEGARVVWQEFGPSQFRRQIGLPADVDGDKVHAEYHNGILLLTAPKAEHAKPRTIKVDAA